MNKPQIRERIEGMNAEMAATQGEEMNNEKRGEVGLLPCPFCGSDDVSGGSGWVHCHSCKFGTKVYKLTGQATAAWNRRAAPAPPAPQAAKRVDCNLRLSAYYYGFSQTGVPIIDRILSAVAWAGKAYHHTDSWTDQAGPREECVGEAPVDWIQNAANDAAKAIIDAPAPSDLTDAQKAAPELLTALQRLEDANDALCQLRTSTQYLSMIDGGQKDALMELDNARIAARAVLAAAWSQQ